MCNTHCWLCLKPSRDDRQRTRAAVDVGSTITESGSLGDRGGGRCQSRGTERKVAASLGGQRGEVAASMGREEKLLLA